MKKNLRILLLQARNSDDPMADHEHECFVKHTGLAKLQIVIHDLLEGPPSLAKLRKQDALMVGGSGNYDVSKQNLPFFQKFLDFLGEVMETGFPTFASCFGYQCMIVALGGEIISDPEATEVGTYRLELTEAGKKDPLFSKLGPVFFGQLGHKERAVAPLKGIPNLVSSELSPFQALRIPGQPIWASQFHPELDKETNLDRFRYYLEVYSQAMDEAEKQATLKRFHPSPESNALLPQFLSMVFP